MNTSRNELVIRFEPAEAIYMKVGQSGSRSPPCPLPFLLHSCRSSTPSPVFCLDCMSQVLVKKPGLDVEKKMSELDLVGA